MSNGAQRPRTLAVIPARGGSKRLPRKNIMPLRGHPLIAYTIKAAQDATQLTDWLVSTDDAEIAEAARRYGAPVPFVRPSHLSGDVPRNGPVLRHALEFMEKERGCQYDLVMLLQPTVPIRDPAHIDQAIEMLWRSDLDALASVRGPIYKRFAYIKAIREGVLEPYNPAENPAAFEPCYTYNGAIYAVKRHHLLTVEDFIAERSVPLPVEACFSLDIDEEIDAKVVEMFMEHLDWDPFGDRTEPGADHAPRTCHGGTG